MHTYILTHTCIHACILYWSQVRSYSLLTRSEANSGELRARLCSLKAAAENSACDLSMAIAIKPAQLPGEDLVHYLSDGYFTAIALSVVSVYDVAELSCACQPKC
jgi:hypothetical protein